MKTIKLGKREIPLEFDFDAMIELADAGYSLQNLAMSLAADTGTADYLKAVRAAIVAMGNSGLRAAGKEPDLTYAVFGRMKLRDMDGSMLEAISDTIRESMAMETEEADRNSGERDLVLEEINAKKEAAT